MTVYRYVEIECDFEDCAEFDGLPNQFGPYRTVSEARSAARESGWSIGAKQYCPAHRTALQRREAPVLPKPGGTA